LDSVLREHPEVFLPKTKQSYFFDRNYDLGIDYYYSLFSEAKVGDKVLGEVATSYCLPSVIAKVHRHLPNVKLVMLVRNPIERAYSNYLIRSDQNGWVEFEQAIEESDDLLNRGNYIAQITEILRHYPREQLLVLTYDELVKDRNKFMIRLYNYLHIDAAHLSSRLDQRKNSNFYQKPRKILHKYGFRKILAFVSSSKIGDYLRIYAMKKELGTAKAEIEPATLHKLKTYYRESNRALGKFLDADLSDWDS
jgi:hypothetical protein